MTEPTTLDGLLNRRVTVEQPEQGYRIAMDTVFLAAATRARAGDNVIDIGSGVGGAILCLACRIAGIKGTGIDIQPELIEIFRRNIARNIFAAGLVARTGNVANLPAEMAGAFDHVLANPPYHEEVRHDISANKIKQTANSEKTGDLAVWVEAAAQALKTSGSLTMIHRADRQEEIVSLLRAMFGEIEILPLLPKQGDKPKRIIIRARKDAVFSVHICEGFVLHKETGGYTDAAEAVLRDAQALIFQSP